MIEFNGLSRAQMEYNVHTNALKNRSPTDVKHSFILFHQLSLRRLPLSLFTFAALSHPAPALSPVFCTYHTPPSRLMMQLPAFYQQQLLLLFFIIESHIRRPPPVAPL